MLNFLQIALNRLYRVSTPYEVWIINPNVENAEKNWHKEPMFNSNFG